MQIDLGNDVEILELKEPEFEYEYKKPAAYSQSPAYELKLDDPKSAHIADTRGYTTKRRKITPVIVKPRPIFGTMDLPMIARAVYFGMMAYVVYRFVGGA